MTFSQTKAVEQYFVKTDAQDKVEKKFWWESSDKKDKIKALDIKVETLTKELQQVQYELKLTDAYSKTHIDSLTTYLRALEEGQKKCVEFIKNHDPDWYSTNIQNR